MRKDNEERLGKKESLLFYALLLFFITLYLPHVPVITNILIGLILIAGIALNSRAEKRILLKSRKSLFLLLVFFLLHIISIPLSQNRQEAFAFLVLRLPLLVLPLAFGFAYIGKRLKQAIWLAFTLITTLAMLVCLCFSIIRYQQTGNAGLIYNDSLTELIARQSAYVALLVNLALFGAVYLLYTGILTRLSKWALYISIAVLLVTGFLLASRINLMLLPLIFLGFLVHYAITAKKYLVSGALLLGLAAAGFLAVLIFPKTLNRFRELEYTQLDFRREGPESHYNMEVTADQWNGANIRLGIWQCGWELFKKHPIMGVQTGDKVDELMKVYQEKGFAFAYKEKRNIHNNYLDVLVSFGLIGLLIFVMGYVILPLIHTYKASDWIGFVTILSLAIVTFTESYFDRSMGCYMMGFFTSFVLATRKPAQ